MPSGYVIVAGAGVLGLTSAIQLARAGFNVLVLARDTPQDLTTTYSSPWAGAHFRPIPITTPQLAIEQGFVKETYYELQRIAENDASAGIAFITGIEYFDNPGKSHTDLRQEAGFCIWPEFRVLDPGSLPGFGEGKIKWGVSYRSWVLNSPVYLSWLQRQFEFLGGKVVKCTLQHIHEAVFIARKELNDLSLGVKAVVNATGMGFADPECFISRGQFLLVSNECKETISHQREDGDATVIIPRPLNGGTLIGGTKEVGNWSSIPSEEASRGIIERVSELYPQLLGVQGRLNVLRVNVGRRPMRKSGLRLEAEDTTFVETQSDGFKTVEKPLKIVHCYGAGGNGYKLSWGAARMVVELVDD